MPKISVYIIAYEAAEHIAQAIQSVLWADEIVVIDQHSTDQTATIAQSLGARVEQVEFQGFGALRNSALQFCSHPWIFNLDTDERCTTPARNEILAILTNPLAQDVYFVPRRHYFMGRWIMHSGWYPNYRHPQLFRQGSVSYTLDAVHEGYILHSGKVGYLKAPIWHYPFRTFGEMLRKANVYSTLGAGRERLKNATLSKALWHALWAFFKHYIVKRGCLDGWPGFVIALSSFEGTFYRYAKAVEAEQNWQLPDVP